MPFGWAGEILRIDLTKEKVTKGLTAPYSRDYIGGRGINARILYDEVRPGVGAFDPENVITFGIGPLTGTAAPGSGRTDVTSKSPITGLQGLSNFGGFFGAELKFAGYDCIVIKGKAKKPVYINIENERVEIKDASHLWGKNTFETMTTIQEDLANPEVKVVSIGPGGEKLVLFASLVHDLGDGAGRTGMGAVMGSKNLKAIAIRGTNGVKIAKPKDFLELCKIKHKVLRELPEYREMEETGGEIFTYEDMNWTTLGNQQRTTWEYAVPGEAYRQAPFVKKYKIRSRACFGCPFGCMQFIKLPDVGVCFQSCQGFIEPVLGLRIPDQKVGFEFARLCEMLGIDIISTVHTLAMTMELYERGILTKKDTGGTPLKWGDRDAIITMVHKIARREGFGDILAEGALRAARKIGKGAENYVMHTKGLSHYIYDLRGFKGCALATAVGHRDMMRALPIEYIYREAELRKPQYKEVILRFAKEIMGTEKAAMPTEYKGKPAAVIFQEHEHTVTDMMGICKWLTTWLGMPLSSRDLTELFCACTGVDVDVKAVLKVAERVRNLERAFNVREGLTRELETLPKRYFKEPLPDGAYKGEVLNRKKFEEMKDEYYKLKGWDVKTGIPTVQKLEELGLKSVINELKKLNKIPAEPSDK